MSLGDAFSSMFAKQLLDAQIKVNYRDRAVKTLLIYLIRDGIDFDRLHKFASAARVANDMIGESIEAWPESAQKQADDLCRVLYGEQQ